MENYDVNSRGSTWSVHAATIRVPQEHATIQTAVNASQDGDEVVVSPGVYAENIGVTAAIVLRSTFNGNDWSIIENTVIKPTNNNGAAIGIGPAFSNRVTIRGFRITRDPVPVPLPFHGTRAVGIHGGANVEYCIIENQVNMPADGGGSGGAILNYSGIIQNNIIRNNYANNSSALHGCTGIIRNNLIYNHTGRPMRSEVVTERF